jgi:serine/threonine-protein kinase RsbW
MKPAARTRPQATAPGQLGQHPRSPDEHRPANLPDTMPTPGFTGIFGGWAAEAARVRREIAAYLGNCPATGDMILIASELAANAILHTRSRGASFTVRCHARPTQARIEVEDAGGPWRQRRDSPDRPHGLDIIAALTGPDGWGTEPSGIGGRIVWAELSW